MQTADALRPFSRGYLDVPQRRLPGGRLDGGDQAGAAQINARQGPPARLLEVVEAQPLQVVRGRRKPRRGRYGSSSAGTPTGRRPDRCRPPRMGGALTCRTGIRRTVPQEQLSSGCGHWSWRPQASQRTVTHPSDQVRWVTGSGGAPTSSGGASGAPQVHGRTAAVYVRSRRQAGQRTSAFSAAVSPTSSEPVPMAPSSTRSAGLGRGFGH